MKFNLSKYKYSIAVLILLAAAVIFASGTITGNATLGDSENLVKIKTSEGDIVIELYPEKAPITVENFKAYVEEGFYDGLVFHRVIEDFMIQGGGYETSGIPKETKDPIVIESNNGLSNDKYTIAMARTNDPNSATSQFFINTADNTFLNYGYRDAGYAVFGKVIEGQKVVDKINQKETTTKYVFYADWPVEDVIIESIELI